MMVHCNALVQGGGDEDGDDGGGDDNDHSGRGGVLESDHDEK